MKKRIKLRDITKEQYQSWVGSNCRHLCSECIFRFTACDFSNCWVDNKGAYSDKFLSQEVEIEVPDILTPEEREYLEAAIAPFRTGDLRIEKWYCGQPNEFLVIYNTNERKNPCITIATNGQKFVGIKKDNSFTLKELGL